MTSNAHAPGRTAGVLAALFAIAIWAGWLPLTRLGVVTRLTPWDISALRFGVAGLILAPVLLMRWREVPWHKTWPLLCLIVGAGVPYVVVFGKGLAIANSGQGAVLGPGTVSAFVALLAMLVLREHPSKQRLFGLAVTLLGAIVVVSHDVLSGGARLGGFAMILTAALCWATYTVASRVLLIDPLLSSAVICVINAVIFMPLYLTFGDPQHLLAAPASDLWIQGIYQGFITAVVALIAFAFAVQRLGANAAASFTPLAPVLAAAFGWFVLGDTVDGATAFGLAMVALGVLIASREKPALATTTSGSCEQTH